MSNSRIPDHPCAGPTCQQAGIKPGLVYRFKAIARYHAARMSRLNPVGFEAIACTWHGVPLQPFQYDPVFQEIMDWERMDPE